MQDCGVRQETFKQRFVVISTDGSEGRATSELLFIRKVSDFFATFSKRAVAILLACYPSVSKDRVIV
jgi:hypothetical protein